MSTHNAFPTTIYVLGTDRDIGKTVTCIGIMAKLLTPEYGYDKEDIAYMKPVGQETLTVVNGAGASIQVDKDAVLITSLLELPTYGYDQISPVVWQGGLTSRCIDDGAKGDPVAIQQGFMERIWASFLQVSEGKRLVILEGTGQPGVGSVAGISNGDVINMLRARGVPVFVIMVAEGGIGSTIDQIFPYLMALDHMGTRIDGFIINGVLVDKLDKIRHYLTTYYTKNILALYGHRLVSQPPPPILGFVPTVPELRYPTLRLIAETFATQPDSGIEVIAPEDFDAAACQLVHNLKVINLVYGYEPYVNPGDAVVVGVNANDITLAMLLLHKRLIRRKGVGLAGLILSCKSAGGLSPQVRDLLADENLPTIAVNYDSADVIMRVDNLRVKIQPYDLIKRDLIIQTYREHLVLDLDLAKAAAPAKG